MEVQMLEISAEEASAQEALLASLQEEEETLRQLLLAEQLEQEELRLAELVAGMSLATKPTEKSFDPCSSNACGVRFCTSVCTSVFPLMVGARSEAQWTQWTPFLGQLSQQAQVGTLRLLLSRCFQTGRLRMPGKLGPC